MKKETIFAIILGVFLGGVLSIVIISKNKQIQLERNKTIAPTEKAMIPKVSPPINFHSLEILKPEDRIIVDKNEISIVGKTTKESLVVIQSPIKDIVLKTDQDQFSVNFPLVLGENVIKIVSYPKDKKLRQQEKELRVYYLKEQI